MSPRSAQKSRLNTQANRSATPSKSSSFLIQAKSAASLAREIRITLISKEADLSRVEEGSDGRQGEQLSATLRVRTLLHLDHHINMHAALQRFQSLISETESSAALLRATINCKLLYTRDSCQCVALTDASQRI